MEQARSIILEEKKKRGLLCDGRNSYDEGDGDVNNDDDNDDDDMAHDDYSTENYF